MAFCHTNLYNYSENQLFLIHDLPTNVLILNNGIELKKCRIGKNGSLESLSISKFCYKVGHINTFVAKKVVIKK